MNNFRKWLSNNPSAPIDSVHFLGVGRESSISKFSIRPCLQMRTHQLCNDCSPHNAANTRGKAVAT
jgi:hypothetical protein